MAAEGGHANVMRFVLDVLAECGSFDLAGADGDGRTALHLACNGGHIDVARALLDAGADLNAVDHDQRTPLHRACSDGTLEIVAALIDGGAWLDAPDKRMSSPLLTACWKGHIDVVTALLEAGADIHLSDEENAAPINVAARYGHVDIVELLLQASAVVDARSATGLTPLIIACYRGHAEVVDRLLWHGADPWAIASDGETAHSAAIFRKKPACIDAVDVFLGTQTVCGVVLIFKCVCLVRVCFLVINPPPPFFLSATPHSWSLVCGHDCCAESVSKLTRAIPSMADLLPSAPFACRLGWPQACDALRPFPSETTREKIHPVARLLLLRCAFGQIGKNAAGRHTPAGAASDDRYQP